MALKDLLKATTYDRYTQDGRDKLNEALAEDVKYKTGDISQKTGLQKQPDGSWAPPKKGGASTGRNLGTKRVPRGPGAIVTPGKGSIGMEEMKEAAEKGLKGQALKEFMMGKKNESKPAENKKPINYESEVKGMSDTLLELNLERNNKMPPEMRKAIENELAYRKAEGERDIAMQKAYAEKSESKPEETKGSWSDWMQKKTSEQANEIRAKAGPTRTFQVGPGNQLTEVKSAKSKSDEGPVEETSETEKPERYNYRAALERGPKDVFAFKGTVTHSIPMSAEDKEQLANIASFMSDEHTDYKDAIKSVATGLVNGNKMHGDWYPEREQSVLKIAKAVGLEDELKNYIAANHKGYEFGYSEDAAPRELTGDTKIRIRK